MKASPGPLSSLHALLLRYPAWVAARHRAITLGCVVLALCGLGLTATLPLHTEFSWLLPDNQPSVVALRELTARKSASAVIEIGVASADPDATRRFALDLAAKLRQELPPELVQEVDDDDSEMRRFIWQHRHLYAGLADLERARSYLDDEIERTHRAINPLIVDLESDGPPGEEEARAAEERRQLLGRLRELRAQRDRPAGYVAEEGRLRMIVVRAPFGDTEPDKGARLLSALKQAAAQLDPARYAPSLQVGYAGDPVTAALEHSMILRDVGISTVLCLSLVMLLLFAWLRAPWAVFALCLTLGMGCSWTFGVTRLVVGHLNSSTAFLGSVVAGNGINFGIILLARYLEERRRGGEHGPALEIAIRATAVPTVVAALAAGTAYLSLMLTSFRGFSEFGIIAGSGMLLCWIASFLFLPAVLTLIAKRRDLAPARPRHKAALLLQRIEGLKTLGLLLLAGSSLLAVYGGLKLLRDPFEDDLRNLRSRSLPMSAPGQWSRRLDAAFGRDQSGGIYIGTDRAEHVPLIVAALRKAEEGVPQEKRFFGKIDALPLALPGSEAEQRKKLEVLAEIRSLLNKVRPHIEAGSEAEEMLRELAPPEGLSVLGFADLPARLQTAFTERDGRHGLLMAVHPGPGYIEWFSHHTRHAVRLLRSLPLPPQVQETLQISGPQILFNDMMDAVTVDGPRATLMSLLLVLLLILTAFGPGRYMGVTAVALLLGMLGMFGAMALCNVRLNFLNYIAIPITIGIGVDYPFNVVARLRQDLKRTGQMKEGLVEIGSAVVLCSLTTMIGYAVLLISDTGAIRSFGQAAVLGELMAIVSAIAIVPWLLQLLPSRRDRQ